MKEFKQFKLEHEKNKITWSKKVEASAGDVQDYVKQTNEAMFKMKENLEEMKLINQRMQKENEVYKGLIQGNNFDFSSEELQSIVL